MFLFTLYIPTARASQYAVAGLAFIFRFLSLLNCVNANAELLNDGMLHHRLNSINDTRFQVNLFPLALLGSVGENP